MPSTQYLVSVAASGLGGCSEYHSRSFWTAPYSPLAFSVKTISNTPPDISVTLQWKAPCAVTLAAIDTYPSGDGDPVPSAGSVDDVVVPGACAAWPTGESVLAAASTATWRKSLEILFVLRSSIPQKVGPSALTRPIFDE